jgi:hypothetical protein
MNYFISGGVVPVEEKEQETKQPWGLKATRSSEKIHRELTERLSKQYGLAIEIVRKVTPPYDILITAGDKTVNIGHYYNGKSLDSKLQERYMEEKILSIIQQVHPHVLRVNYLYKSDKSRYT